MPVEVSGGEQEAHRECGGGSAAAGERPQPIGTGLGPRPEGVTRATNAMRNT